MQQLDVSLYIVLGFAILVAAGLVWLIAESAGYELRRWRDPPAPRPYDWQADCPLDFL